MNKITLTVALLLISQVSADAQKQNSSTSDHWVATWATAQDLAPTVRDPIDIPPGVARPNFGGTRGGAPSSDIPATLSNQTVRMVVHASIGGRKVRVEISNAIGKAPILIGNAHIAVRTQASEISVPSDRTLTFGGRQTVTIQPGVLLVSDPVDLEVKPMSDLAVSFFLPKDTGPPTTHALGLHSAYITTGDTTANASVPDSTKTSAYLWLSSVDVVAPVDSFAIVTLGDSITDGYKTTPEANQAWPTLLAKRLAQSKATAGIAVLNQGISGNEVLKDGAGVSALARFDRDVLSRPGVKWIVLLEGVNDLNLHGQITGTTALQPEDLIFGYRQIIDRAHAFGIKVMGATIMPEEGTWPTTPVGETKRLKLNDWIRTSHRFDAVVDFDEAVRDPSHTSRLRPDFNPGDNIHPNDAGNSAMADKFNLEVFRK